MFDEIVRVFLGRWILVLVGRIFVKFAEIKSSNLTNLKLVTKRFLLQGFVCIGGSRLKLSNLNDGN